MFSLIGAIIIGGIAGAIAKFIMPGRDGGGIIVTIILGIVGALVATFLGQALGWYAPGQSTGFIGSIVGAIIVLFVYRLVTGRRTV
ncbi:MAG: GlsB/YeaQ/YmgE family stress response membrane protein [Janthinobacterium lividum]